MTDLNPTLLRLGQPDLEDDAAPARGMVIGCILGSIAWMVICGVLYLAVWE